MELANIISKIVDGIITPRWKNRYTKGDLY
jgi:hypothetical protein